MKIPAAQRAPYPGTDSNTVEVREARVGGDAIVYLTARQVRARYGDCSDMSLWRWEHNPDLNFPKPLRIQNRKFWRLSELVEWEQSRPSESQQPKGGAVAARQARP